MVDFHHTNDSSKVRISFLSNGKFSVDYYNAKTELYKNCFTYTAENQNDFKGLNYVVSASSGGISGDGYFLNKIETFDPEQSNSKISSEKFKEWIASKKINQKAHANEHKK
jgi:hypothetical protein